MSLTAPTVRERTIVARRQEQMTIASPGKEPITGVITWVAGPRAQPDAPISPCFTAPDGTVVTYAAVDRQSR
jgi:hypothetical protein